MHRRWMSLPLLSTCVSAFYPVHSGDGGDSKGKRFIPFSQPEGTSSDESGVFTLNIKKGQVKRDNTFPVLFSNQPSNPNALAINQDGSDFSYFSTVKFGSEGKEMYMLIDTGSANTWVMGSKCKSASCGIHNTFGSDDSSTLKMTTKSWELAYGTGEVDGNVVSDSVAFANYNLDLSFGLATVASDDFNNYPMDGILGFGPTASNDLGVKTIMQALDDQTDLKNNILGIHLQRAVDGTSDGELIIGDIDKTKFTGDLNYLPIQSANSWEIKVDDAIVAGKAVGLTGRTAIIDTGTSYILMPPSDAESLHSKISGSSHNGEMYTVPCDTKDSVQIALNGVKYTISPKDYVGKASGSGCTSNIIGHQAFGPTQWILGDVFLKNVYSVFDFDQDRIGFGVKSTSSGSSSSSSSSPSSSSDRPSSSGSSSGSSSSSATGSSSPQSTMATSTVSGGSSSSSTADSSSAAAAETSAAGGGGSPFSGGDSANSDSAAPRSIPGGASVAMMAAAVAIELLV